MSYNFLALPQVFDHRNQLASKGNLSKRKTALKDLVRVWHHSLSRKHLAGSTAQGFANYHVNSLGWERIGYTFVIEPQNIIDTPKGKRARIVYANNILDRSYHVGNSNDFSLGICVAGDYRYDQLDDATLASMVDLHRALKVDKIGKEDKSHHEMPGYAWKQCSVFDYAKALNFKPNQPVDKSLPEVYVVQQGDTLWGLAKNDSRFTVEDLMKWNNIADPSKLQVGQKLSFKQSKVDTNPTTKPENSQNNTTSIVDYLDSIGVNSSLANRKKLAKEYGINNYTGTAGQNTQLLNKLRSTSAPKSAAPKKEYVVLPASAQTWRTYKLGVAPVAKNSDWSLTPAAFGGLTYEILNRPQSNVVTIKTSRGKRNIYVGPDTSATFK
ncbi:LysM peptidoglycan-binding domain-containing protein [Sutcliffiella sp. NC1]|uniref:LysM peptidoglycan-binding domain-containing protein n=1 Tax=Sutcliffiella sp. NC1 TaxID=3004096 RepID=UPI0022DD944D|nr:LysM peptidoglycan-binding domain-containing protein [Sutcliffiella sp. NC1]WBL16462.1 LysM peptidoglycan-binding domain-containing protein [Sutcliffiella sp. NC1]